jgi:hypothetical protein
LGSLKGRSHLEYLDADEDNTKMDKEIRWDTADWIYLVRDKDQWRAVVNTVRNLRVP